MNGQTLRNELKALIVKECRLHDLSPADIGDDDPLFKDGLGLDSLDAVALALVLETRFKIEVPDEVVGEKAFHSIRTLADYVLSQISSPPS